MTETQANDEQLAEETKDQNTAEETKKEISPETLAVVKGLTVIAIDVIDELPEGEAKQAIDAIIEKLKDYTPGDKPSFQKLVEDAATAFEAIADVTHNEGLERAASWVKGVSVSVANGLKPFQALLKELFKKHLPK